MEKLAEVFHKEDFVINLRITKALSFDHSIEARKYMAGHMVGHLAEHQAEHMVELKVVNNLTRVFVDRFIKPGRSPIRFTDASRDLRFLAAANQNYHYYPCNYLFSKCGYYILRNPSI